MTQLSLYGKNEGLVLRPLRPKQSAAIEAVRQAIKDGHRRIILQAPCGFGKCHGKGTEVIMYDGSLRKVEDVRPGNFLMGPDSQPREVLSTTKGFGPLFRIVPHKGEPFVCNDVHVLSLKRSSFSTKKDKRKVNFKREAVVNIPLDKYLRSSRTFKSLHRLWRTAVEFPSRTDEQVIPPYILGLWLGDGSSRTVAITTADHEIAVEFIRFGHDIGLKVRAQRNSENSVNIHLVRKNNAVENRALLSLRSAGVLQNKHIPNAYKLASRNDRLALLAGIIDTDGAYIKCCYTIHQKSRVLAEDIAFVARSVGLCVSISTVQKQCTNNGKVGTYYAVNISGDVAMIPCRLPRKQAALRVIDKDPLVSGFSVEPIGNGTYYGFTLSGDHLYLLRDFTVTHNTLTAAHIISGSMGKGKRPIFTCPAITLVEQTLKAFEYEGIMDIGIMQAQHEQTNRGAQLQIASVQTLIRRALPEADLILIDEAHLLWKQLNERLDGPWKDKIVIGLTATPWTRGMGLRWTKLIIAATTQELIDDNLLSPFTVYVPDHNLDRSKIKVVAGEFQEKSASELMSDSVIIGDVVKTWKEHADGKTFAFCVNRAHAKEQMQAFHDHGIPFGYIDALTPMDDRTHIFAQMKYGEIAGICSVACLIQGVDEDVRCLIDAAPTRSLQRHCLDSETEILTSHGWRGMGQIAIGDCVASTDEVETLRGCWSTVVDVVQRPMDLNEKWIEYDAPRANFRVTDNHRMIAAPRVKSTKHHAPFRVMPASETKKNGGMFFPTAVHMRQVGVPLTDAELYFIGMMMTDGSWTTHTGAISQSERHPEVIARIEKCLKDCKIAYTKKRVIPYQTPGFHERNPRWVYTLSLSGGERRARPGRFGEKKIISIEVLGERGFRYLLPYLDKDLSPSLMQMSQGQLLTFIQGLWDGDGFKLKCPSVDWTPRSWQIISARKKALDRLQALCAVNGMTASISPERRPENGGAIWSITITPKDWRHCGGYSGTTCQGRPVIEEKPSTDESVWCVETTAGTIVTRRRGKVTVMGNCQKIGRGLRTADGKEQCIILDHAGNSLALGLVTDIHIERLDTHKPGEKGDTDKQTDKVPKPKKCEKCHTLIPPGKAVCPRCGERIKQISGVEHRDGELILFSRGKQAKLPKPKIDEKQAFYSQALGFAQEHNFAEGWASWIYRDKWGVWPKGVQKTTAFPSRKFRQFERDRRREYVKKKRQEGAA